jgi:hypothetical protein
MTVTTNALRLLQNGLSVRVNIVQPKSDQDRFTAERVARTRPKTYRAIVRLLADPDAKTSSTMAAQRQPAIWPCSSNSPAGAEKSMGATWSADAPLHHVAAVCRSAGAGARRVGLTI